MVNKTNFETINIDDFNHDPINQEKVQSYPPELVGRFNSFIVTAFDDSMTVEMQIRTMIKWVKENIDVTMSALDNMEAFKQDSMAFQNHVKNTLVNLINQFTDKFDDNLQFEMQEILKKWDDEGYLQSLINDYTHERIDDLYDHAIRKGDIKMSDFTPEVNEYLAGVAEHGFPVASNTIVDSQDKVLKEMINPYHLSFTETTTNKFNPYNLEKNKYISSTGEILSYKDALLSDVMYTSGYSKIYFAYARRICFKNDDNEVIAIVDNVLDSLVDVPEGATKFQLYYFDHDATSIRGSKTLTEVQQVNYQLKLPYEPYLKIPEKYLNVLKEKITPEDTIFFELKGNIASDVNFVDGSYINWNNGKVEKNITYSYFKTSKFEAGKEYVTNKNLRAVTFFNESNFINSIENIAYNNTFIIPEETTILGVSLATSQKDGLQIEKGLGITSNKELSYQLSPRLLKPEWDTNEIIEGYYVDWNTGKLMINNSYATSDPIYTDDKIYFNIPLRVLAFYDDENNFISAIQYTVENTEIIKPINTYTIRASYDKSFINKIEYSNRQFNIESNKTTRHISLPPVTYGVVGLPMKIYFENITETSKDTYFNVTSTAGEHLNDLWKFTPTASMSEQLSIDLYNSNFEKINYTSTNIKVATISKKDKTVLIIGDSTVNAMRMTQEVLDLYANETSLIKLLGTRGSGINRHEGRGGWTTSSYRKNITYDGSGNPFFNPDINDFDFSYYMTQQSYEVPTDVIFQLGINDVFSFNIENIEDGIDRILNDYEKLIQSVISYDPTIQIGITVTIPPNASQDVFGNAYKNGQNQWTYKRNNAIFISKLINHFKNRESENIRLIGQNACIDTNTQISDGVHPTIEGYQELGKVVYAYLKNN